MRKRTIRLLFIVVILASSSVVTVGYLTADDAASTLKTEADTPIGDRQQLVDARNGATVITSHLGDGGEIVAYNPNGTLLYFNDTHKGYWDVDPVEDTRHTVIYSATDVVSGSDGCDGGGCIRQQVEQVNLSTGEVETLYSQTDHQYAHHEWHDVDRINESHLLVGDMAHNRAFIVNTSSNVITWEWNVESEYPITSGGPYPEDWAHLNDVEQLSDGRIMVSLRNHDQVAFINRTTGVREDWTLGQDDSTSILYEQHNPDYIPEANGGPALLVADSENNRIVEYQRENGEWNRSWTWKDAQLQWGRDADRLPNGNTLITDTHGGRVVEVDQQGAVVWQVNVSSAYEAERLGTGDESTGGPSAVRENLQSVRETGGAKSKGLASRIKSAILSLVPNKMVNGLNAVLPPWMNLYLVMAALVVPGTLLTWSACELYWAKLRLRSPVVRR